MSNILLPDEEYEMNQFEEQFVGLNKLLDSASIFIEKSPSIKLIENFASDIAIYFDEANRKGTKKFLSRVCQNHPLFHIIMEDPYSKRAFEKPLGYAGDALMLDFIYRPSCLKMSKVGAIVHAATIGFSNAKSILWRQRYIAKLICNVIDQYSDGRVLSVASGHMRELDLVAELTSRRTATIWAIDQDASSIEECIHSYKTFDINPINEKITYVFGNKFDQNKFDLIYSAGLSDYLSDRLLEQLISRLYCLLDEGGKLMIGNFNNDSQGRGFMEAFLDWSLVYRDEFDLLRIAENATLGESCRVFRDEPGNVSYIEIRKTGVRRK